MNPDLILFLEENGFACDNVWKFRKMIFHNKEKEVKVLGYGTSFGKQVLHRFELEAHTVIKKENDCYDSHGLILSIEIHKMNRFDLKIKKLINEIDSIISLASMFEGYIELTDNWETHIHDMMFSSPNGLTIDISKEEILIMNNENKLSMVL